jgi:hypothetical protein
MAATIATANQNQGMRVVLRLIARPLWIGKIRVQICDHQLLKRLIERPIISNTRAW